MSLALLPPTVDELNSYQMMAKIAIHNPMWRKIAGSGTPEEQFNRVLSCMLLAREIGIQPMSAASWGLNNVNDKFEVSARGMNDLIRRRQHKLTLRCDTHDACVIWGKRKDTGEEMEVSYTIEEAARAGLIKEGGGWKKNPRDMLFARAISRIGRRLFADCIGGFYIEGELQESIEGKVIDVVEVPPRAEFKEEKEELVLALPREISKEHVDEFILKTSQQTNFSITELRQKAAANLQGFLQRFKVWEEKEYPGKNNEVAVSEEVYAYN